MQFDPTVTLGDLGFFISLIFMAGVAWMRLRALERGQERMDTRVQRVEGVLLAQTRDLQRVIGAFEMHAYQGHGSGAHAEPDP